jgi:hypothetical protein
LHLAVAVPQPNRYSLLIGSDWNRHHTTMQDLHRDEADPPDPPLYDEPDDDDDHPSLTAKERNSRFHCQ